ncbi:hypothetical protein [Streptomyces sp. NPDC014793]|uniref:hypothetical protein n=1 Tax=Streptomyces sp. NPDC014793 TaxID=3364914 RepID=UPI0036F8A7F9
MQVSVLGRFVAELRKEDAFGEWEVHRPIEASETMPGVLPLYVRRSQDEVLCSLVAQAAGGGSRMAGAGR